jgi:prolipoprotein diacylglyceryltransferase
MKYNVARTEELQFITKEFADGIAGKTPNALQGGISVTGGILAVLVICCWWRKRRKE